MQDEAKIQALLQFNTPENQKVAIQLIQSQWGWTLEKAFDYVIEFYCKTDSATLFLYIGNTILSYVAGHEIESDYKDAFVVFQTRGDERDEKIGGITIKILGRYESFAKSTLGHDDADKTLADYVENIKTHFKEQLPTISQY